MIPKIPIQFKLMMGPVCLFCQGPHRVKEGNVVTCPSLRSMVCRHCSQTGDGAHLSARCPSLQANLNKLELVVTVLGLHWPRG